MNRRAFTARLLPTLSAAPLLGPLALKASTVAQRPTPINIPHIGPTAPEWVAKVAQHPMVKPLGRMTVPSQLQPGMNVLLRRQGMEVGVEHVTRLVTNAHGTAWLELQQITSGGASKYIRILATWGL